MPVAAIGSAAIGAGASIFGASAQASAAKQGIAAQQGMYATGLDFAKQQLANAQGALNPFIAAGGTALGTYQAALPGLTAPFSAANLAATPGYQFTLGQGLKSTQNAFAAQGLGSSGAALRGAGQFATGLAQGTYTQQLQNYLQQNQQIANLLYQPVATGAGAAGTLAGVEASLGGAGLGGAVTTGQGIASSLAGLGNAYAGGAAGVSGALTGGLNTYMLSQLLGGSGGISGIGNLASIGAMPATGAGSPSDYASNIYALSQGINPFTG